MDGTMSERSAILAALIVLSAMAFVAGLFAGMALGRLM